MKHTLKPSEVKVIGQQIYNALIEWKEPKFAREMTEITQPIWDEVIERTQMPEDIGKRYKMLSTIASDIQKQINVLTKEATPTGIVKKIEKCYECYKDDDAIGGIIDVHIDFGFEGFHVKAAKAADDKKIKEFNKQHDMDSVVLKMWGSMTKSSHILLSWSGKGKGADYVTIFDPRIHLIKPTDKIDTKTKKPGFDVYRKVAGGEISEVDRLTGTKPKMGRPAKAEYEKIGAKENVLVRTFDGGTDRMIEPIMVRIFPDYELRRLIRDGDFTIFFHIKHMIHQIQVGASETEGASKAFWQKNLIPTETQLLDILNKYKNSDKTMVEVTNAMQKHNFIAPDPKYLDDIKYKSVLARIRDWGSVQGLFSDSTKYASGYLQVKTLKAKIRRMRKIITRLLQEFYRLTLNVEEVSINWDEHNMLEPKEVLERLKAASERGLSNHTFMEQLDFHPDSELKIKKKENAKPELYFPPFEAKQGITLAWLRLMGLVDVNTPADSEGDPGKPPNNDEKTEVKSPDAK